MAVAVAVAVALPVAGLVVAPGPAEAETGYRVNTVAEGLQHTWGLAFLPEGDRLLVTERPGRLALVDIETGEREAVSGVPEVAAVGQGGLLDVALHPDFAETPWVYLTYAGRNEAGLTSTYLGRGQLDREALALTDWEVLTVVEPHMDEGFGHYGSRIAFDGEGHVFITVGDRQQKDFGPEHVSQDLTTAIGSTLRLNEDGSVPEDNPFVGGEGAEAAIWSYGHRNSQGMAFHPETGELWQNEHGENNGDEINVIVRGGNYGWPVATYGRSYRAGEAFAVTPPEDPDSVDPVYWWEFEHPEGFPPSGFAFYDGDAFPEWQGDAFVGNLAHEYLGRFTIDGHDVELAERLLEGEGWRIRAVAVGPNDGYLYVLIDAEDAPLIRLEPGER